MNIIQNNVQQTKQNKTKQMNEYLLKLLTVENRTYEKNSVRFAYKKCFGSAPRKLDSSEQ